MAKKLQQTVQHRWGNQGMAQAVFSRGREQLTLTGDIVEWWKEHFDELLNCSNTSSVEKTEFEDQGPHISLAEVAEVVKKLLSSKVPGFRCG